MVGYLKKIGIIHMLDNSMLEGFPIHQKQVSVISDIYYRSKNNELPFLRHSLKIKLRKNY